MSEEIARAFALPDRDIMAYNVPIVPRKDYEEALRRGRGQIEKLEHQIQTLQCRLTQINSLPEPEREEEEGRESEKIY